MESNYLNEFNAIGAPSEDVKRKLLYLAETGSEAVTSAYRRNPAINNAAQREERDAAEDSFYVFAEMALASQEQVAAFRERLDLYDQASLAALRENEEKLRKAQQTLQDIRNQAYEITQPDGTIVRLYRDERSVRREDGAVVDPEVVRAEDVSQNPAQWSEMQAADRKVMKLERERLEITRYSERLKSAGKRVEEGELTASELDELEAGLVETMPDAVRRRYEGPPLPVRDRETGTVKTTVDEEPALSTDVRPTETFKAAVSPASSPRLSGDNNPSGPHAGTPAPM